MCELCLNKGWIWTYNTSTDIQEIQKCDDCAMFESDKHAQEYAKGASHD